MIIPRYLFRADSPGSDGSNSSIGFRCQASCYGNNAIQSLTELTDSEARDMLQDHVLWLSRKCRQDDILISFSSSFLFVVQHCERKIKGGMGTTRDNCFITILDTEEYQNDTFQWTVDLLRKYDLDEKDNGRLLHTYHEGEYLAERQVDTYDPCAVRRVPFQGIASSMYRIAPDLQNRQNQNQLVKALNKFRTEWYLEPEIVTDDDIFAAYSLAHNFGDKWFLPITVWGLAMKRRRKDEIQGLADRLLGMEDFSSNFMFRDQTTVPVSLRELKEWNFLMQTLYLHSGIGRFDSDATEGILHSLAGLQISTV